MRYDLGVDSDFVQELARPPIKGVSELIWNAIDADSTEITVDLVRNQLDGVQAVIVRDNGHGIAPEVATQAFSQLGGSWKATTDRSPSGRPLHGCRGRGRFSVFKHGGTARWTSVFDAAEGGHAEIELRIGSDDLVGAHLEAAGTTERPTGTAVVVEGFASPPAGLLGQGAIDELTAEFALPIQAYQLRVTYDGDPIDPQAVIARADDYDLDTTDGTQALLKVIEWKQRDLSRRIYLCTGDGLALEAVDHRIQAPGLRFTAYLSWHGFDDHPAELATIELQQGPEKDLLDAAREQLRIHFRAWLQRTRSATVAAWKEEAVYPFKEPPATPVEEALHETFDLVALQAADVINQGPANQKRLSLSLMREALEQDPGSLHHVLEEVLALPQSDVDELSELLRQSPLAKVIKASRTITDRLSTLAALSLLVTDPEWRSRTRERSELHKIIERETWIFGDEYSLTASDKSLQNAMKQHIELLGRKDLIDEAAEHDEGELLDQGGKRRILDLMLSTSIKRPDDIEQHLVLELKRPSVNVGDKELLQIKNYARVLAGHPAFDAARTRWEFWVVSSEVSDSVEGERRQPNRPTGLAFEDPEQRYAVWVKTWSEILHDGRQRLTFVREQLGFSPEADDALEHLRTKHAAVLGG